jgi:hypothetical protein
MNSVSYSFTLDKDEEKLAQLLTRDAWMFFSQQISDRESFHLKEIPMMPRRGSFELTNDAELIQYYIDKAYSYSEELTVLGWDAERISGAAQSFVALLEGTTGIRRGTQMENLKMLA